MIKATLLPLNGKYYGTIIRIDIDGLPDQQYPEEQEPIAIWVGSTYAPPSDRQLTYWGYADRAEWDAEQPAEGCHDMVCDSHYESTIGYMAATQIVDAINRANQSSTGCR